MNRFNFRFILKKSVLVVLISGFVSLIYLGYFFAVGIPKTQARNYFLLALKQEEEDKIDEALRSLTVAKNYWNEDYILEKIETLSTKK